MKNNVPFNDTARIYSDNKNELLSLMSTIAASGWWLLGKQTESFSKSFAEYCKVEFCVPLANGTDALELAIKAVIGDPKAGTEIITVANAGGYSTTACRLAGVIPVYADIEPESLLIDMDSLKRCLGPDTKAVILTHLFGGAVDVHKVRRILDEANYSHVKIIEDCAQAHGAKVKNSLVGSLGDIATFSFYPTKNLGAMGDAGAITTNSKALYSTVKSLQQYGWNKKYEIALNGGRNSRMDELQAGILSCLLPSLNGWNKRRIEIYNRYRSLDITSIEFLDHGKGDYVAHLAIIKTPQREEFMMHMAQCGVAVDIHYPVLDNMQEAWKNMPFRIDNNSNLSVSLQMSRQVVSIPCFPTMTNLEVNNVCNALTSWTNNHE